MLFPLLTFCMILFLLKCYEVVYFCDLLINYVIIISSHLLCVCDRNHIAVVILTIGLCVYCNGCAYLFDLFAHNSFIVKVLL